MVLLLTLALAFDLATVQSEPNPEKRSEQALEYADSAIDTARDAYQEGRFQAAGEALKEVEAAVTLSYESLEATGKDPRDNSKHFKKAEKATRQLLRRLNSLRDLMSSVDQGLIDPVLESVAKVHDDLLIGIMGGGD